MHACMHTDRQTDRHTQTDTNRQTDRQANRHTGRQTDSTCQRTTIEDEATCSASRYLVTRLCAKRSFSRFLQDRTPDVLFPNVQPCVKLRWDAMLEELWRRTFEVSALIIASLESGDVIQTIPNFRTGGSIRQGPDMSWSLATCPGPSSPWDILSALTPRLKIRWISGRVVTSTTLRWLKDSFILIPTCIWKVEYPNMSWLTILKPHFPIDPINMKWPSGE